MLRLKCYECKSFKIQKNSNLNTKNVMTKFVRKNGLF